MPSNDLIQFRGKEIIAEIAKRSFHEEVNLGARRDLEEHYHLLGLLLNTVYLSRNEACFLVDVWNGSLFEKNTIPIAWADVADSLTFGYAEKWEVDGQALLQKVRSWSTGQLWAVIDAVRQFWTSENYQIEDTDTKLRQVGLVRDRLTLEDALAIEEEDAYQVTQAATVESTERIFNKKGESLEFQRDRTFKVETTAKFFVQHESAGTWIHRPDLDGLIRDQFDGVPYKQTTPGGEKQLWLLWIKKAIF